MEELLPLIIGILWLVYTFYSKSQKKKARERSSSPDNQQTEKPSFLQQLMAGEGFESESPEPEEYEEDKIYKPFEQQEIIDIESEKKEPEPFLQTELSEYMSAGDSRFTETFQNEQKSGSQSFVSESELIEQIQEFDLKKAVVYSEILNAPYIDYK